MAHKTLINGTSYDIIGGKTLINGTSYSVKKGITLINGTSYDINFNTGFTVNSTFNSFAKYDGGFCIGLGVVVKDANGNVTDHIFMYNASASTTWINRFNYITYTNKISVTNGSSYTSIMNVPEGGSVVFESTGTDPQDGTFYLYVNLNGESIGSHMIKDPSYHGEDGDSDYSPDHVISPVTGNIVMTGPTEKGITATFEGTMEGT